MQFLKISENEAAMLLSGQQLLGRTKTIFLKPRFETNYNPIQNPLTLSLSLSLTLNNNPVSYPGPNPIPYLDPNPSN